MILITTDLDIERLIEGNNATSTGVETIPFQTLSNQVCFITQIQEAIIVKQNSITLFKNEHLSLGFRSLYLKTFNFLPET